MDISKHSQQSHHLNNDGWRLSEGVDGQAGDAWVSSFFLYWRCVILRLEYSVNFSSLNLLTTFYSSRRHQYH